MKRYVTTLLENNFNSIKVRLEQTSAHCLVLIPLFQFHKGTIRTIVLFVHLVNKRLFQFHKGTIRTYRSLYYQTYLPLFQFHKGTIRTDWAID